MVCWYQSVKQGQVHGYTDKNIILSVSEIGIFDFFDHSFKPSISLMVAGLECCTLFFGVLYNFYPLLFCLLTINYIFSIYVLNFVLIQRKC